MEYYTKEKLNFESQFFRCVEVNPLCVSVTVWGLAFWWARLQVKICSLMEEPRSEFAPWLTNFQLLSCGDQLRHQQHRQPLIMSSTASPVTNYVIRNGHKVCCTLANDWHIFKCSLLNQDQLIHSPTLMHCCYNLFHLWCYKMKSSKQ